MLNSLRDGQINYATTNCPSAHIPPHNVVAPIHQNPIQPNEHTTPVVYPWNSNSRLDHFYGFHSRYYNLDFPTPYPPATNQYVPPNMYGQNIPQCCQPCCRLRSQNIPKTSPPQVLYNPIRPVQQLNRSSKSKKALKTPCSEQFLPYIPNDIPVKYDTQNCYQQKYNSSYLNNTNYCPPANNLWIPPAPNPTTWPIDRLRPVNRHADVVPHDFGRNKNYQRLPNYQSNPYPNPTNATHLRHYNYIPPISDVNDYRPPVYHHNSLKTNSSDYVSQEQNSRLPISSQNNQIPSSSFQQYYNAQPPISYSDVPRPSESFKSPQINIPQNSSKSNLNVREFLATWDEGEEETNEKSSETTTPIVVLDCMPVEGDALTKIQEKLNVVSYEHLEKVLKENQNPVVINTESNEIDFAQKKSKPPPKSNFEPLDYTKRETGIIKPFITEKKTSPEINTQSEKSYSVNFDGMVAWYGKKNTDISSTDLIERLADRIFNLSKSQENDGLSFGTAAYTGQITQTNRSIVSSAKDSSKYLQSPNQMYTDLHHCTEKSIEPPIINKLNSCNDSIPRTHSFVSNENNKAPFIKSNNTNSSCIVENITKKCLNVTNEQPTPWNLDHGSQEQHLNTSLYDHSVIIKPLDFSSLTDETKCNPFAFDKNTSNGNKPNIHINDQCNKIMNENNNYNSSSNQHSIQQIDSSNRNFPVIVSPNIHRQEYNGFHESVIHRTGYGDKSKHDKVPAQTDFESMNWNISNDFDKIMKNSHIPIMEPSCMYDRNNYNILDTMNSNKNVSNQWKDNVPCVDLTVNSKSNSNHDSFFDGWNFIENYENHSIKKIINSPSNNNEVHNQSLYPNLITSLEGSKNKNNNAGGKVENETLANVKNIPFSKPNDMSSNNARSRDVFDLNNRIPDFSDGFELPIINEPHEYIQFNKRSSNDGEHRTDGSIFEHLNEPKLNRPTNESTINAKNDQIKSDNVGLSSFKEKEPLAPMPAPPKLNIVKPILRDPSQIYTVIKQKMKYDNNCIENDNVVANKIGHNLRINQTNVFNGTDLKSKYNNNEQLNQFDVWSEKFVLKGNTNDSSSAVVQCDVEITQFKSTPDNRNTLMSKPNIGEHYQDNITKLQENTNCNIAEVDKISINEDDKINSNDFLNCLESTKTDDQKYQDTLDEFETSFGFDMHCNNESNKSFHEDIVDKCLEESIKDQIGEHNVSTSNSANTPSNHNTSNNTQSPFQCDFQSNYLIKNHFNENTNKTVDLLDEKRTVNHEKSSTGVFSYNNEIQHEFELRDHKNIHEAENKSDKDMDFDILNDVNRGIEQNQNETKESNSNFINNTELKHSFEPIHNNTHIDKNSFNYLTMEGRNFEFDSNNKSINESTNAKEISEIHNPTEANDISKEDHYNGSNFDKLSNAQTINLPTVNDDFKLHIDNSNIFETNLNTKNTKCTTETNGNNKNSLESSFHYENVEDIKNDTNNKYLIFQLENNNGNIYQTNSFKKIHDFNFEMDCSNSNVQSTNTNEIKMKTQYTYDINNEEEEKNIQKETNLKSPVFTQKEHTVEESPDLDRTNGDTSIYNRIKTENIIQTNKVVCINEEEKLNHDTYTDFDIQNKNTVEHNHNHFVTHENLNNNNNAEVDNILKHLYDNLTTLNTEKDNSSDLSESVCQNYDDNCDVSKSRRNIENRNSISNDLEIINDNIGETKIDVCHDESDETFEECDNVLLEKFVNNPSPYSAVDSLGKNEILKEEKPEELISYKYIKNTNENFLAVSNETIVHGNIVTLEEQLSKDIKQSEVESINQTNTHTIKHMTVDTVQCDGTKNIFENIKTDLLNTIQNMNSTDSDDHCQHNSSEFNSLKHDQSHSTKIVLIDDLISNESSSLNDSELLRQRYTNDVFEVEHSTTSESNSLNHFQFTYRQQSDDIFKIIDLSKSGPSSSKDISSIKNYNDTVEVDDSPKSASNLHNTELTYKQHSNDIDKVEASTSFSSYSLNHDALTCQQNQNYIIEAEDSPKPEPNVINDVKITCQKYSNKEIEVKDLSRSGTSSLDDVESIRQQHPDEIIVNVEVSSKCEPNLSINTEFTNEQHSNDHDIDDSTSSYSNTLDEVGFTYQQHHNDMLSAEDSPKSGPTLLNDVDVSSKYEPKSLNSTEFTHEQHSDNLDDVDDSISSGDNTLDDVEFTYQKYPNDMLGTEDSPKSRPTLLNDVEVSSKYEPKSSKYTEFTHERHFDDVDDSTSSDDNTLDDVEFTYQQYPNDMLGTEDSPKSGPILLNDVEVTRQKHSDEMMVDVDVASKYEPKSSNYTELTHEQHSNDLDDVDDSTSSDDNTLDDVEFTNRQHPNDILGNEDSSKSGPTLLNDVEMSYKYEPKSLNNTEFTHDQHSDDLNDFDDSTSSGSNTLDDVEFTNPQHPNDILGIEDSPKSGPTLLNDTDVSSKSSNYTEFTHEQHSNDLDDVDDSTSSDDNTLDNVEFTNRHHPNDILGNEDSSKSGPTLLNDVEMSYKYEPKSLNNTEFTHDQHSDDLNDFDDSTSSGSNTLDDVEFTNPQHPNDILGNEDSPKSGSTLLNDVEVSSKYEPKSLNNTEFTHDQHSDDLNDFDDSTSSGSNTLDDVEFTYQQHPNNMLGIEDSPKSGPTLLNDVEVTRQKHFDEMLTDVEVLSKSESPFNHTELTRLQHPNEISQVNESICSESNSLNDVGLINHQHISNKQPDYSINVKSFGSDKIDSGFKSNYDSCLEKKDSKSVIGDIILPRVKFILKSHSNSMIKTNVFDEESIVPHKKLNMTKDKNIIAGHIYKKRINFYKPWKSLCKTYMHDKPEEIIRDVVETERQFEPKEQIPHDIECVSFDSKEENNERVLSVPELTFTNEERCDETPKSVGDIGIDKNVATVVSSYRTPSADGIHIEMKTSDHYAGNDFWDKSLENEYKTVLHKTISKLAKNRINIRDKFNVRLLARRTVVKKGKKRRRWRRQRRRPDNTTGGLVVADDGLASKLLADDDRAEVPAATVLRWTSTAPERTGARCKIKVQLPWGRIFNLNNRSDANSTKLELGPAKVEVRMSETPGEWQVAASRSTTMSKSVVSVRRLVLQRAETTGGGPSKESSDSGRSTAGSSGCSTTTDNSGSTVSDNSDNTASDNGGNTASDNGGISGSCNSDGPQADRTLKLPKIVIRRNGQNNNYISYVSSGGFAGGNINDGSPQLMVRLVRDSNLDAMAVNGITTLHLKHFIPESDTHDAKRVRYT